MPQRFFKLADDVMIPGRWHLAMPRNTQGGEVDDYEFWRGAPVQVSGRLSVPIESPGKALDYTEAGLNIPVVHLRVASMFAELAPDDVQLIPVDVEGQPEQYLILVAKRLIRCIDEQASRIELWTHEDGVPHKVGQYSSVRDLRIDKSKVGDVQVFRCEGWEGPLIVSEKIRDGLAAIDATGPRFQEV